MLITKAKRKCISIRNDCINLTLEPGLYHLNGPATTIDTIEFKKFGIVVQSCISLFREVQTYQWVKKEKREGIGRKKRIIITYEQEWSSLKEGNTDDCHLNHDYFWTVKSKRKFAPTVNLGVYELTKSLKAQAKKKMIITPLERWISLAETSYPKRMQQIIYIGGDYLYFGQERHAYTIGDQRIQFYQISTEDITVVSKIVNNTFEPFSLDDKSEQLLEGYQEMKNHLVIEAPEDFQILLEDKQIGFYDKMKKLLEPIKFINWLQEGLLSKNEIFDFKLRESRRLAWYTRLFGFGLMTLGIILIFAPIVWLISWFPLLGNFLAGLSVIVFICFGIVTALTLSILTITIAWLRFHPIMALIFFLVGCCFGVIIWVIIATSN